MAGEVLIEEIYKELLEDGYKVSREEVIEEVGKWLEVIENVEEFSEKNELGYDFGWTTDNRKLILSEDKQKLYMYTEGITIVAGGGGGGTTGGFKVVAEGIENIVKFLVKEYADENFERE